MADKPTASDNNSDQNWLQRQWQRVRTLWARDIVIGQVGEGATNVIIGKNNVQINVGGRNLSLPIWLIALFLLVIVIVLLYPLLWPYWSPTRMKSTFNIAVTDFSEQESGWFNRQPDATAFLSTWLAEQINDASQWEADKPGIQVWQNDLTEVAAAIQPPLPKVTTDGGAQRVAEQRNAHLVIYGDLNHAADPALLTLRFYYKPPPIRGELVDVFAGPQQIGKPVTIANIDSELYTFEIDRADHPLRVRTLALIWLARGLFKDLTNDPAGALQIFTQAEAALLDWKEEDGKWLLYFLQGREAFILHQLPEAEHAFSRAIAANKQSRNSYFGRANVYYDLAQRGLLAQLPIPAVAATDATCQEQNADENEVVAAPLLPQNTAEILAYTDRALADYTFVAESPGSQGDADLDNDALLRQIAQWMIGNSYRLKADVYLHEQQFEQAEPALTAAESALTTALNTFTSDQNLVEFAIHTRYNLGLVKRAQGYRAKEGYGDWRASKQWYRQAQVEFAQCIEEADQQWPKQPRFFARSARCSCQAFAADVEQTLQELEDQQGGDG